MLRIGTKADLGARSETFPGYDHEVSVVTGAGVDGLLRDFQSRAGASAPESGDVLPWRMRHVELLGQARGYLEAAVSQIKAESDARAIRHVAPPAAPAEPEDAGEKHAY